VQSTFRPAADDWLIDVQWFEAVSRLRRGQPIADEDWDVAYPPSYVEMSRVNWTPVSVARRAAELLSTRSSTRILDIGAGVGKFCVVAALTAPGTFIGVERFGAMVDVARAIARKAGVSTAHFVHGRMEDFDWTSFDGFYLFNPFVERWCLDFRTIGPTAAAAAECRQLISFTEQRLALARSGTRVVTYHGFGGEMPRCFRLKLKESIGTDFLECWEKT
jgi:SAM-dependent methyltransferase